MEPKQPDSDAEPEVPPEDLGAGIARRFKEEQARRAAEHQARDAEARLKRETEQQEREEQERVRAEALEARRRDEEARRQEEEERKKQEEVRVREHQLARTLELAEQTRKDVEDAALRDKRAKEAAAKLRQEVAERTRPAPSRHAGGRSYRTVTVLFLLLAAGLFTLNFVPFEGAVFERAAAARLGTPVKIGSTHFSTLPLPALRFEHVAIGPGGEVKIAAVTVKAGLRTLLEAKKHFEVVEMEGAQIPLSWFAATLWGKGQPDALRVDRVVARGIAIQVPGLELPAFNVDAKLDAAGGLQSVEGETADRTQVFTIEMKDSQGAIQYRAKPFTLPFAGMVKFDDFVGSGTLTPSELVVAKFDAGVLEGSLSGSARLRWDAGWSLDGEFVARSMDPARITGKLVPTGRLEGKGTFSMRAPTAEKLQDTARLDSTFTVLRGTLGFIDLTRHLQGGTGRGGTTAFEKMDGSASLSGGQVQLRRVRLDAGLLNATGEGVVDAQRNLNARFQVELTSARTPLSLGGTVAAPQVKR